MTKRIIGFSTNPTTSHINGNSPGSLSRTESPMEKKPLPSHPATGESEEVLALMRLQKESIERFKKRFPNGATIEEGEFLSIK